MKKTDREFEQICSFIRNRRNEAIGFLNYATVSTYWTVGAYVSRRIKSNSWGAGTVQEFEDYIKTRHPNLRGYGRRQIYNMVGFYEAYSSLEFGEIFMRLKLDDFVLKWADEFVQPAAAQMEDRSGGTSVPVKAGCLSIVQPAAAQLLVVAC